MLVPSVVDLKSKLQEPKYFAVAELKPESKLFKVGTGTTTNYYDSAALLVSKFLGFNVSNVQKEKFPELSSLAPLFIFYLV